VDTVSVILPYYNRPDTLEEAVRSVLCQTHSAVTLYLINDGTTDPSRAVAHSIDDERIRHLDVDPNRGVSRARNAGLEVISDRLVAFMDSDDVWLPMKLEVQIRRLREAQAHSSDTAVIGCGWNYYQGTSSSRTFLPGPFFREDVLRGKVSGIGTPMLLVDRGVAADARFDVNMPALEDREYVISCLANGGSVVIAPEPLACVRRDRTDHAANSRRAANGYEVMLKKHGNEMDRDLESWYAFRASREHLIHGDVPRSLHFLRRSLRSQPLRRGAHLVLGAVARSRGLAAAQKFLPL